MFNKQRVQSLINLNLTKFFRFRDQVRNLDEITQLSDLIFPAMAKEIGRTHKLTVDEYLDEVREALQDYLPQSSVMTYDFWVAYAHAGWQKAFPEGTDS